MLWRLAVGNNNNNNNRLYSSQWEIKACPSIAQRKTYLNNYKSWTTRTYTLLGTRPLSLNLHTLIANPKLPGIMLSLCRTKTLSSADAEIEVGPLCWEYRAFSGCPFWHSQLADSWHQTPLLIPSPFLSSAPLHGMIIIMDTYSA